MHRHHETTVERLGARKKSHRRKDWPSRGRHVAPARSAIRGPWSEQPGVGGTSKKSYEFFLSRPSLYLAIATAYSPLATPSIHTVPDA